MSDYRDFGLGSEIDRKEPFPEQKWWKLDDENLHKGVQSVLSTLQEHDEARQNRYADFSRLYGQSNVGAKGGRVRNFMTPAARPKERLQYNVVQSAIDTATAKVSQIKPKPMFLTSGGNYKLQRKAKKLDKFVEGIFTSNEFDSLSVECFKDAAICGDGMLHVFAQDDEIKYERVSAGELFVDWFDGYYGKPRQIHRQKTIDRDVLAELFPKFNFQIYQANISAESGSSLGSHITEQVIVTESWHLKSGKDAKDGKHAITIDGATLFVEEYEKPFFPFVKMTWSKNQYGYWGRGIAEMLESPQLEINKILWIISRSMHLAGSFKILVETGSKIVQESLNNQLGTIVYYTGKPPIYITPNIVPIEYYNQLVSLKQSSFEQVGISQLSANQVKPAGLDSGKALRTYSDIENDRQHVTSTAFEQFAVQVAELTVSVARDLYEKGKVSVKAKVPGKKFIESIEWKKVSLEDDEFFLKVYPVSSLPTDPAGRIETIKEMMAEGIISPRMGQRLLDFPDLDAIEDLQNSQEDVIRMNLEKIVEDGDYNGPDSKDDLDLAMYLALEYYAQGRLNGLEDEKLALLIDYIEQCDFMIQASQPQIQPNPMPQDEAIPEPTPMDEAQGMDPQNQLALVQ